jgi:hypothetical protein
MENFANRMVTPRVFESYTPLELVLRKATVDNPEWVKDVVRIVSRRTGRHLTLNRLDVHFRQYINAYFPLATAESNLFENYVLWEEETLPQEEKEQTEQYQQWRASHPYGQRFDPYPRRDDRYGPSNFDLVRFKN